MTTPEFGNDVACANCGDEWAPLSNNLCAECSEVLRKANGCSCPMERVYSVSEICDYCRDVAFYDDPDYAEHMGFVLVEGKWQPKS